VESRFWQMPNLILCVFVASGFAWICASIRTVPRSVWLVLAIGAVAGQAALNWRAMDNSANRWTEMYGRSILAAAPPGALMLTRGDLGTNTARYLRYVENVRPDVQIVDQEILSRDWGAARYMRQMPDVHFPGAHYGSTGYSIKQLIDANIRQRRILVCGGFRPNDRTVTPADYRLTARGLCMEVERAGTPLQVDAWLEETRPLLPDVASISRASFRPGTWEEAVRADFWNAWHTRAHFLMLCDDCGIAEEDRLWRFLPLADEIVQQGPSPPDETYKDRVYALTKLYSTHPDLRHRLVLAMRQYLEVAPPDDPQLPVIRKNLAKLGARAS
jgi:hypothetical protein